MEREHFLEQSIDISNQHGLLKAGAGLLAPLPILSLLPTATTSSRLLRLKAAGGDLAGHGRPHQQLDGQLVPQRLPEPGSHVLLSEDNCAARSDDRPDGRDVLLLVVYLLHSLGEVGLQLVVRVRGLLRTVVRTSDNNN